jgi:hypothetical protein
MARFSFDLTGAEPIVRDMIVEAGTYVNGQFAAMGKDDGNARGFIVTGAGLLLSGFMGIFNEDITATSNIDTPTLSLARIIINPFAVWRAVYDQTVLITAAAAGPTFTCGSSLGDVAMGGSWLYRVAGTGAGELDLVEDSSTGGTTCTVVTANTATEAFASDSTFIVIQGQGSRVMYLGATKFSTHIDSGQDNIGTGGIPAFVYGNYLSTAGRPPKPLGNGDIGLCDLDHTGVNPVFSSDVCMARGHAIIKEVVLT